MFVVIAYDITNNRRRLRLMKMLEGYGEHVQESVFECDLKEAAFQEMIKRTRAIIDPQEDNVRIYALCRDDVKRILQVGIDRPVQLAREVLIV